MIAARNIVCLEIGSMTTTSVICPLRDACAKFTKFDDFYGYVVYEIPGGTRQISVPGPTAHEC